MVEQQVNVAIRQETTEETLARGRSSALERELAASAHRERLEVLCTQTSNRIDKLEAEQLPAILDALSDVERRQSSLDTDAENLVNSVPVALRSITWNLKQLSDAISSLQVGMNDIDALRSLPQRVSELSGSLLEANDRVEFVRREIMFEMRYGASGAQAHEATREAAGHGVEKRVVASDKLAASRAEGNLRLNLGCGHIPLSGYLNLDRRELPGVDIVADAGDIPVEAGEVAEVFSAHMLEHFPQEQLRRQLLPYWRSLLGPGGTFRAVVPDAEAMIREYSEGRYPYDDLREVTFGAQDYDGDFHFNMFTPSSMAELLIEAGFKDVRLIESARRNGACYEFDIAATK